MQSLRLVARGSRPALSSVSTAGTPTRRWGLQAAALHTSAANSALSKFMMPAMSPTMTEGGIASWKKKAGDTFIAGDVLLEIETDKATMDVEAQDDGVMAKVIVGDGSKNVAVNSVIAIIGEEGDDISGADALASEAENESPPKPAEAEAPKDEVKSESKASESEVAPPATKESQSKSASQETSGASSRDRIFASPLARRLAQEKGFPLGQIKGTGPDGRIVKADVEAFKAPSSEAAPSAKQGAGAVTSAPSPASTSSQYTDTPISSMRKVIASRLTESKQQLPHYYVSIDVEMDKVLRLRQLFNEAAEKKAGGEREEKESIGGASRREEDPVEQAGKDK